MRHPSNPGAATGLRSLMVRAMSSPVSGGSSNFNLGGSSKQGQTNIEHAKGVTLKNIGTKDGVPIIGNASHGFVRIVNDIPILVKNQVSRLI